MHIAITGIPDGEEKTLGGVVVKYADENDAPRQEITLSSTLTTGTVELTRSNTKIKVFTAETGGTEITFNATDNVFNASTLPLDLYVEGATESESMRDVELTLTHALTAPAKAKFTIVWVTLTTKHTGTISADNSAKAQIMEQIVPTSSAMGFHLIVQGKEFAVADQNAQYGLLSEFIGTVKPSDFKPGDFLASSMYQARELISGKYHQGPPPNGNATETTSSPGNDTGQDIWQDEDPQSGAPPAGPGKIYDLDYPRITVINTQTANWIIRKRTNFQFWAVFVLRVTPVPTPIRCSEKKSWYHRLSVKLTGATDNGTATAGTANTLTDGGKAWTADQWKDGAIYIRLNTGAGQVRAITGNTATKITAKENWDTVPNATSQYWLISSTSWTKLAAIMGDNQNGDGSTNTTWNLA